MNNSINRQAAIDFIGSMEMCDEISAEAYRKLTNYLDELPSAEPKRGHWELHIFHGITGERRKMWTCDNCNGWSVCRTDFCPNCGADMRGENNG